ncbi:hypothetical protein JXI42_00755 [bacterium]|nr:hypothetical protein [bacterium]
MKKVILAGFFICLSTTAAMCSILWSQNSELAGEVEFLRYDDDYTIVYIEGWEQIVKPGAPILPAFPLQKKLDGKYQVEEVEVTVSHWEELQLPGRITLLPGDKPIERKPENRNKKREFVPNPGIYGVDEFYPNESRYTAGFDGNQTVVAVLVSAKYNHQSNTLQVPRECRITALGHNITEPRSSDVRFVDENLIITPPEFYEAAESVATLHDSWGITSEVILTDWIMGEYDTAPQPPLIGYPEIYPDFDFYYNRELAQRLISFLRDESAHPNLKYVTLFGDAFQVPPSFYYSDFDAPDLWFSFVPTDFFYASPDYDWIPQYGVGRVLIQSNNEGLAFLNRLRRWYSAANSDNFSSILFAGGKPFWGTFFDDEHTEMHIANDGIAAEASWDKLYATRESFNARSFDDRFVEDCGFIYEMGHGSGYELSFDDGTDWGVHDVRSLPSRAFAPVLFAGVCSNGMFDQDVIPVIGDEETFPEAMLKSPGGPIAVFAATRSSFGAAISTCDSGRITSITEEFITDIGYRLATVLTTSPATLGDWYADAVQLYTTHNDMEDLDNVYTVLEFIMHGDPALPLPAFSPPGDVTQPSFSMPPATYLSSSDGNEMPAYHGSDFTCEVTGAVESFFSFLMGAYPSLLHSSSASNIDMSPDIGGIYQLSADAHTGAEQRIYTLESASDILTDGNQTDWVFFGHEAVAEDPDDFEEDWLELRELYALADEHYLYIGFSISCDTTHYRKYGIAFDYQSGGYTGTLGSDTDPSDIYVCFSEEHAVDAAVSFFCDFWGDGTYSFTTISQFIGDWDHGYYMDEIGGNAAVSATECFAEIAIPRDYFGLASEVSLIVYSSPSTHSEDYPAQDCVPSDPAAYHSLTSGSSHANRLTNFVTIPLTAITERQSMKPTGFGINTYPNPFNSSCRIEIYGIKACNNETDPHQDWKLEIFDIRGNMVTSLPLDLRNNEILWDASNLSSGVYLGRLCSGNKTTSLQKMLLVK